MFSPIAQLFELRQRTSKHQKLEPGLIVVVDLLKDIRGLVLSSSSFVFDSVYYSSELDDPGGGSVGLWLKSRTL
jgi:hypothetical protein